MKTTIICLVALLAALTCLAPTWVLIPFEWDANTEPDLKEYHLFRRISPTDPWVHLWTIGAPTNTVSVWTYLSPQVYEFHLTAVNTANLESLPSNIAAWDQSAPPTAPNAPANFKIPP
jgi:hypothetical protein